MPVPPVDKELPWDVVTKTVAQAVARHLPETIATEAYYYLVMQHLAGVLWRLGAGDLALQALGTVLRSTAQELRELVIDAPTPARGSDVTPNSFTARSRGGRQQAFGILPPDDQAEQRRAT